jgi:hypothetical protein
VWSAAQDGIVIRKNMSEDEVWITCNAFGAPALVVALEEFIADLIADF